MLEKPVPTDLKIIGCLNSHYGIEATTLTFLPIGADIHASVYKAETVDQRSYFIKLKRGHHPDTSVELVELLKRAGIRQVIPAVKTTEGRVTQPIEEFTLIVYPFVQGQDGFNRNLTDTQWIKLGKALRQVHEVEVPSSIQNRIRRETYSPKWREVVRSLYPHMESEASGDEIKLQLQKFMKKQRSTIHRLVDRAEELGDLLRSRSTEFRLCHSDIHAGNVLIDGNDEIYLVDWDEPIMAPKERDLMFIGGGVGNVWNQLHEETSFYQGYGKTKIDLTILAYYRHERIVQELLLGGAEGEERSEMYRAFLDQFAPHGVVEIAFKTDEALSL